MRLDDAACIALLQLDALGASTGSKDADDET